MRTALDQCRAFLTAIFNAEDVIEFRPLNPPGNKWATLAELPVVVSWLSSLNARQRQIYFGANPRRGAGRSDAAGVLLARCLFTDFDGGTLYEDAMRRIRGAGLPMPTAVLNSGGGIHAWWRLDAPTDDAPAWSRRIKALAVALGSDQSIHDWPRIMRLPGFINWKYDTKPVAQLLDVDPARIYSFDELAPRPALASADMGDLSREFLESGKVLPAGRRQTMFTVACDLAARGWSVDDATTAIMERMRTVGLPADELADCPRQIANALKTPRTPLGATSAAERPQSDPPEAYRPFPADALPEPLASFVTEAEEAIGCDASYVALPLLACVAAAIGTTRRLELKPGFSVPAILWTVIVGESGTSKTPALKAVLEHVRERQSRLFEAHRATEQEYEVQVLEHEKAIALWRRAADSGPAPVPPALPAAERAYVSDTTVEALAVILADNQRGILVSRDELAGWLGSLDRYAQGKGADEAFWLSSFNAEPVTVDRRTGTRKSIHVPTAAVCVTGGIQPGVLQRALGQERRESGLLARLLLTAPPPRPKQWRETSISPLTRDQLHRVLDRLYDLQSDADDTGAQRPALLCLDREAKRLWIEFYDAHNAETAEHVGDLAAAWSKLEEITARLALLIHEVRIAANVSDVPDPDRIDADTMAAAIRLIDWFKHETKRVYAILAESDADRALRRDRDRLVRWIERYGGETTARDAQTNCRWLKRPGAAEAALDELVKAGAGIWIPTPPGTPGKPTRRFLLTGATADTNPEAGAWRAKPR
jgi:hypothetical protein